jgi:hypothetical protein
LNDKEGHKQTEVHRVNSGKSPASGPEADVEGKSSTAADAAKQASRTDDSVV